MKPRFTLRDLFWLMLVVGLATGWGIHASLPTKADKISQHKIYGFDLLAAELYRETGILMTVDQHGVTVKHRDGTGYVAERRLP